MPGQIRSAFLSLAFVSVMAGAAATGWQLGAPKPQRVAAAVPTTITLAAAAEPTVAASAVTEVVTMTEPALAAVAPAQPVGSRMEDLPAVPVGPIEDGDLPLAVEEQSHQFAALSHQWQDFADSPSAPPAGEPDPVLDVAPTEVDAAASAEVPVEASPSVEVARAPEPAPSKTHDDATPPAGVAVLHLASYLGHSKAEAGWSVLISRAGKFLTDSQPEFRAVEVKGRRYIRLLARLPGEVDGASRCAELRRAGFYCAVAAEVSNQVAKSESAR